MMRAEWLIKGQICKVIVPTEVTDEMLYAYDKQLGALLDEAPGKVNVIVDVGTMTTMPNVRTWLSLKSKKHANFGLTLIVGLEHKPIIRFFASVVSQTMNLPFKGFPTEQNALDYLHEMKAI
jgi:hypothetical protein